MVDTIQKKRLGKLGSTFFREKANKIMGNAGENGVSKSPPPIGACSCHWIGAPCSRPRGSGGRGSGDRRRRGGGGVDWGGDEGGGLHWGEKGPEGERDGKQGGGGETGNRWERGIEGQRDPTKRAKWKSLGYKKYRNIYVRKKGCKAGQSFSNVKSCGFGG